MSEILAHYSFLPWLRQGLSAKIKEADSLGAAPANPAVERAELEITAKLTHTDRVEGKEHTQDIIKTVKLVGPGDVAGIDLRAIIRTYPAPDVPDFAANLLPYIEFYEEDFPWRYTPAHPSLVNDRRLRPWLALVVLKADENNGKEYDLRPNPQGLAVVSIRQAVIDAVLPGENEIWAWAHVQMNHFMTDTGGDALTNAIDGELRQQPDNGFSRLLSPRKLVPKTAYTAFVVPVFETGRLTGLGLPTVGVAAQEPAWHKGQMAAATKPRPLDFPVYHHWNFHTDVDGDFETLVSILKPIVTRAEAGTLPMDLQTPGYGLDGLADSKTIGFEGALMPPGFQSDPFPAPDTPGDNDFNTQLGAVLNLSADFADIFTPVPANPNPFFEGSVANDPILVPPVYGVWHAMIQKLGDPTNPNWIETLNRDPRYRGAAGLGSQVIRDEQENLMHRAWQQVDRINEANQRIREGELARQMMASLFQKHLSKADADKFTQLTGPLHSLVKRPNTEVTFHTELTESRIPNAASSAGFRRLTRPQGMPSKAVNQTALAPAVLSAQVLTKFNAANEIATEGLTAAPLKAAPASTLALIETTQFIAQVGTEFTNQPDFRARELIMQLVTAADVTAPLPALKTALKAALTTQNPPVAVRNLLIPLIDGITSGQLEDGFLKIIDVGVAPFEALFGKGANDKRTETAAIRQKPVAGVTRKDSSLTSLADVQLFSTGLSAITAKTANFIVPALGTQFAGGMTPVRQGLSDRLDPRFTVGVRLGSRLKIWDGNAWKPNRNLKPVMAYPEFPDPAYVPIRQLSQDFILPNVAKLPQNSITIMQSNQKFIESVMAGLNHEMSRELLWREFPTDQRGSYFRQFWSVNDNILETNPERKLDMHKMHEWSGQLGRNGMRPPGNLVLVVRGHLFKKYPNTLVYAQKAKYDGNKARQLNDPPTETNVRFPIFTAELQPDIYLFGFELGLDEARGTRVREPNANTLGLNPGWFFVFKERPGQPQFGLDDFEDSIHGTTRPVGRPATWNDLSWEHLVPANDDLKNYTLNFGRPQSISAPPAGTVQPTWGENAADMASILFQNPVLFARHAAEMLPE